MEVPVLFARKDTNAKGRIAFSIEFMGYTFSWEIGFYKHLYTAVTDTGVVVKRESTLEKLMTWAEDSGYALTPDPVGVYQNEDS